MYDQWYPALVAFLRKLGAINALHQQQQDSVRLFANYLDTFESPTLKNKMRSVVTEHSTAVQELIRTKQLSDFNAYVNRLDDARNDKVLNFQVELINIVDVLRGADADWFWSTISDVYRSILAVNTGD